MTWETLCWEKDRISSMPAIELTTSSMRLVISLSISAGVPPL